ncbi:GNAT family N-acetyltransferase [Aeromicrobium sp. NPDC092404]|uniref:GNAT family N-acetyltransferase n=1 Tax=Aeromicrobium sp. NPDC092404 TaxID=3154976 RepID=UPI0034498156
MNDAIETPRLVLRPYVDGDAERILDIHSRLEVIRWLSNPPFVPMASLDEAHARMKEWRERDAEREHTVHLAIEPRETGVLAGGMGVTPLPGDPEGRYEVGWHLHPDAAGHGYASEAAVALLDTVFADGLDEVWCTMYPHNEPSARVAQRIGLTDLGIIPDRWYGGDSHIFHMTRQEWLGRDRD